MYDDDQLIPEFYYDQLNPEYNNDQNIPQYDGNLTSESMESEIYTNPIPVIISTNRPAKPLVSPRLSANIPVKYQSKKVFSATQLPVVVNLNPRSVYNKKKEFIDMMEQLDVDICCMSESWDRQKNGLENAIKMEGYQIVKNVLQRTGKGGKPALIIKKEKYFIKELSPGVITVPPTVEASWALLTPKIQVSPEIKHIAVASVYYPKRTKRKAFVDHICETYNLLLAKYGQGLQFIIAGDFNRLNIKPILNLSPSLSQVVQVPTRMNPDAILDKIITTLSKYFLPPTTLPPLDNDLEGNGKPSDHLIVVMRPISQSEQPKLLKKTITFRPLPESGMLEMKQWLQKEQWLELYKAENAHKKAEILHETLFEKLNVYMPEKTIKIGPEDSAWINNEIKTLDRKMKREYNKRKKSAKWKDLNEKYKEQCKKAKQHYSKSIVNDLKASNPAQWYSKIKRMSSHSQEMKEQTVVQDMIGVPDEVQVERIADQFSEVSNEYSHLKTEDIDTDNIKDDRPLPEINPYIVFLKIKSYKKKISTVPGDIPMKVIQFCA